MRNELVSQRPGRRRPQSGAFLARTGRGPPWLLVVAVLVLVAADHLVLLGAAWLAMGLVMADLERLRAPLDLDGRAFPHSYDWTTDPDGDALEAILTGPMVLTQWINRQYYFRTVDNAAYGSGSKVTQNPVANVGVYQGNGGDILTGLPQESVTAAADDPYHQPLRLSTVVHAPALHRRPRSGSPPSSTLRLSTVVHAPTLHRRPRSGSLPSSTLRSTPSRTSSPPTPT
jgi:hypothetical protein